jgi:hypothetical protein
VGRIKDKLARFNNMKLVCEDIGIKEYYLVDSYRVKQGEFFVYWDGVFKSSGFYAHGNKIGKHIYTNLNNGSCKISFFSIVSYGKEITEEEHRKELAKLRLGLIECPQLSLYLKDYGYEEEK